MNHYEELGVGRDAPTEEIRQAYKTLARLLHPDSQADEKLKAMAERQMQRLNEILEILTDPPRRRAYDESLVGPRAAVEAPWQEKGRRPGRPLPRRPLAPAPAMATPVVSRRAEWVQSAVRYWFWLLLGATCVATAAMWWAMPPERNVPELLPVRPAPAPVLQSPDPRDEPKRNTRVPARGKALEASAESKPNADPKSEESPFAGTWLYTPQAGETTDPGPYPAVSVEFLLAEENGDLVGSYRAKYKVPDKAVSPEVVLRIRGRAPLGRSLHTEWSSGNGARGVLEMTLREPRLMSVAWWTTEIGRQFQLTSGSAMLVRK